MLFPNRPYFWKHLVKIIDRCHPLAFFFQNVTTKNIPSFLHPRSKAILRLTSNKLLQNLIKSFESFIAGIPLGNIDFYCVLSLKSFNFTSQKLIDHFLKVVHALPSVGRNVIKTDNYQNRWGPDLLKNSNYVDNIGKSNNHMTIVIDAWTISNHYFWPDIVDFWQKSLRFGSCPDFSYLVLADYLVVSVNLFPFERLSMKGIEKSWFSLSYTSD